MAKVVVDGAVKQPTGAIGGVNCVGAMSNYGELWQAPHLPAGWATIATITDGQ